LLLHFGGKKRISVLSSGHQFSSVMMEVQTQEGSWYQTVHSSQFQLTMFLGTISQEYETRENLQNLKYGEKDGKQAICDLSKS
ncbi:hypothetical protein P7K49_009312, partial [Saguinus oedipus]